MGAIKAFQMHCRRHGIDDGWVPHELHRRKFRRALNHFEHGYFFDYGDLAEIAGRLGGVVEGGLIALPAPGLPGDDRSLILKINPARPHDFYVYSCPADFLDAADGYVRALLELPETEPSELAAERVARALDIWSEARDPAGTLVETYLRSRRLRLPPLPVIRFYPDLYHGDAKSRWPAMVALLTDVEDRPTGVHLTYLARDGSGKADLHPDPRINKEWHRRTRGIVKGSGIRLAAGARRLLVGEGIETVLSAQLMMNRPAWAVGGAKFLQSVGLPFSVSEVTILVDGDEPGRQSARAAAAKWRSEGRTVALAPAPEGKDFNDLLVEAGE